MRFRLLFSLGFLGFLTLLLQPGDGQGQFPGRGGPGSGFGGPSRGPGGPSGPGGPGSSGSSSMMSDPARMFEFLSRGRGYFLVSDTQRMREPLMQWMKENNIQGDKITKEMFSTFGTALNKKVESGSGGMTFGRPPGSDGSGFSGGPSMGFNRDSGSQGNSPTDVRKLAEYEFQRRDRNGDGMLNLDEMPDSMRSELSRWDPNQNNLVSFDEYLVYFQTRAQERNDRELLKLNPVTVLIEEELDARPVVFRAGKLPKDLPKWFDELDNDKDGQVALHEWRAGSRELEGFRDYDRNDDGFLTAEEVLRQESLARSSGGSNTSASAPSSNNRPSMTAFGGGGEERKKMFENGGGMFGGGKFGGGNFGGEDRKKMFEMFKKGGKGQ